MAKEGFWQLSEKIQLSWIRGGLVFREMSEDALSEFDNIKSANREIKRVKRLVEIQTKKGLEATLDAVKTYLESLYPTEVRIIKPLDILEPSLIAWKSDRTSHYRLLRFSTDSKDVGVEMTRQSLSGETIEPLASFIYQPYRDEMITVGKNPSIDPMKPWYSWSLKDKALAAIDLAHPISNNFFENLVR